MESYFLPYRKVKIGHRYNGKYLEINTAIGTRWIMSGQKVELKSLGWCETALHYNRKQEPIPVGEILEVKSVFINFYGAYVELEYNGKRYDVASKSIAPCPT